MKARNVFQYKRIGWRWAFLLGLCVAVSTVAAAETNAPPAARLTLRRATTPRPDNAAPAATTNAAPAAATNAAPAAAAAAPKPAEAAPPMTPEQFFEGGTNTYNNWVEFGVGGFLTKGNKSQVQQRNQNSAGVFGGITDFHLQETIATNTTMTVDGRGIFDEHDYKLNLAVEKEKLGYLRFSASEFRTWYNGDGGFYPAYGHLLWLSRRCAGVGSRRFLHRGRPDAGQPAEGHLQVRPHLPGGREELDHLGWT